MIKVLITALLFCTPAWAGSLSHNGTTSFGRVDAAALTGTPGTIIAWHKPVSFAVAMSVVGMFNSGSTHQMRTAVVATTGTSSAQQVGSTGSSAAVSLNINTLNSWNCNAAFLTGNGSRRILLNADVANAGSNSGSSGLPTLNRTSFGIADTSSPSGSYNGLIGPFAMFTGTVPDTDVVAICKGWGLRRFMRHRMLYVPYPEAGAAALDWQGGLSFTLTATTDSTDGPAVRP